MANARLVSVFKGAGDASGEAAKHASDFAESLGKHIGVDPEVIKGGEAILATFHSVSGRDRQVCRNLRQGHRRLLLTWLPPALVT